MTKSKKCVIRGYGRDETIRHLNDNTTDLNDLWYTIIPKNCVKDNITPIKVFESKVSAKPYFQMIKKETKEYQQQSIFGERIDWFIQPYDEEI